MRRIYLCLFFCLSIRCSFVYGQNSNYVDSIFNLVVEGRLTAFDSSSREIPFEQVLQKFEIFDTVINDQWTRPRFIDNVFHDCFDGVAVRRQISLDSSTFNISWIAFLGRDIDKNGNIISEKRPIAFMIKRDQKLLDPKIIKQLELRKLYNEKANFAAYSVLKNSSWRNLSSASSVKKFPLDSCQLMFRLQLDSNLTFHQSYHGRKECFSKEMHPEINAGSLKDAANDHYKCELQKYFIANSTGMWLIENQNLVLTTDYGKPIAKFMILGMDANGLDLATDNYRIKLAREN